MLQKDEDFSFEDFEEDDEQDEQETSNPENGKQGTSTNLDFLDVPQEESGCFTDDQVRAYIEYTSPSLQLVTSYNYVDFEDIENPFKQQLMKFFNKDIWI